MEEEQPFKPVDAQNFETHKEYEADAMEIELDDRSVFEIEQRVMDLEIQDFKIKPDSQEKWRGME